MPGNTAFVTRTAASLHSRPSSRSRVRMPAGAVAHVVELAAAGDERAWRALVDEFAGVVWAATRAHRLDHADAADVVQATFVRLVEHLGRLQQPDQVGAWLATTARRECLLVLRQRKRVVPPGDALPEPVDVRPEHGSALVTEELAPHDPDAAVDGT